ncbi:MAG: hypothetical protein ACTHOJ_03395 [Sphingomonas oligoaromativorans]
MRHRLALLPLLASAIALLSAPATASSTVAWTAGESAARNACVKASGLNDAAASAPVHFSDRTAQDVILVTGRYPQKFMKGKPGTMLCLYDRRAKKAETQEAGAWARKR